MFESVACAGDQGGALVDYRGSEPIQVGVASCGVGCALSKYPSVYVTAGGISEWVHAAISI